MRKIGSPNPFNQKLTSLNKPKNQLHKVSVSNSNSSLEETQDSKDGSKEGMYIRRVGGSIFLSPTRERTRQCSIDINKEYLKKEIMSKVGSKSILPQDDDDDINFCKLYSCF